MAKRVSRYFRPVLVAALAAGAVALSLPAVASAMPPVPVTVADVQKQLGELALQNIQLVERYDQAQVDVGVKQKRADRAQRVAFVAETAFAVARTAFEATITAQYEGGSFSAAGALLSSQNRQSYLDQLNVMSMVADHTAQLVASLETSKHAAESARRLARALLAAATTKRNHLVDQRAALAAQVQKYTDLLGSLTAAQRAAYLSIATPQATAPQLAAAQVRLSSAGAGSQAARTAVQFALNQLGKPYVFGAAGPDSYDCSGLTMAAWAAAGVSLPHSAADQYNYGTQVSLNALRPGDLIFFYQPIGHVTIYLGNGLMVSAPQPGENVSVVPLSSFNGQITGATRLA